MNIDQLIAELAKSGTGASKIEHLKKLAAANPNVLPVNIIDMAERDGITPGTIQKARQLLDNPPSTDAAKPPLVPAAGDVKSKPQTRTQSSQERRTSVKPPVAKGTQTKPPAPPLVPVAKAADTTKPPAAGPATTAPAK